MGRLIGTIAALIAGALLSPTLAQAAPAVAVASGVLRGNVTDGVEAFLGVPYAEPPVADLRWRPPQPPARWAKVRDATRFGASCMQAQPKRFGPYREEFLASPPFSEDCLFLNVWAPVRRAGPLPVLVWFHGGGFDSGSGAIPIYNGAKLAAKGAVVITVNYRLGVFGFLAYPGDDASDGLTGNFGLQDQIAALKWVRDNVAKFGGDPANVTIAGQSAGAASVNDLIMSPKASGLFQRGIAESGSGMGVRPQSLQAAQAQGVALAREAGVSGLTGLRRLSAERLVALTNRPFDPAMKAPRPPGYAPIVDGAVLPASAESGEAPVNPVPLLTGFNADEGLMGASKLTPQDFEQSVRDRYGSFSERILAVYPHGDNEAASRSAALLARDRYMASLVIWAEARRQASSQPLYLYMFDHPYPQPDSGQFRTFHTAEVPYVFGQLNAPGLSLTPEDYAVSAQVDDYWLSFMRSGTPAPARRPPWPETPGQNDEVMDLGDKVGPGPAVSNPERLAVFREYVASGGKLSLF